MKRFAIGLAMLVEPRQRNDGHARGQQGASPDEAAAALRHLVDPLRTVGHDPPLAGMVHGTPFGAEQRRAAP